MENQHYKSYEQTALDILRGKRPEEDKVAEQKQQEQPQENKPLSEEAKEEQVEEAAVHPDALHVKPVKVQGQTKYKVHAVGKNFSSGIKVGEHLSDTELDDFSEMGGKIKHMKEESDQIEEQTPTRQQVKQAIGIARDPRYKKGNVTGAVKAMDKVNKGLAQHPVVKQELQKQNEEVDQVQELKTSTIMNYKDKANKEISVLDKEAKTGEYKDIAGKIMDRRMKGTDRAANKLNARMSKEEVEMEDVDFTVIEHKAFVIDLPESLNYSDYLNAAKTIVQEEQDVVTVADYFFNLKDESLIIESFTRSDIDAKVNAHTKAGHEVTMPKYSTKEGKPYAEYTVTNKETGQKTRYIHHGTTRKTERLG